MGFKINGSTIVAAVILAGVAGYMATGEVIEGGQVDPNALTIAERNEAKADDVFAVRVATVSPQERQNFLRVRGRTKAESMVPIRAETTGVVEQRLVDKGDFVEPGTLVCKLDPGTRQSQIDKAEAAIEQARFDLDSSEKLLEQGFTTRSRIQGLRAALNKAQADLDDAMQAMERTEIVSTVSGIVQDPVAEVGDNLQAGGACVTLVDLDPMLLTVQVGEQDIFAVKPGQMAQIELVTGQKFNGEVAFVSSSADAQTRTFTTEIEVPNPDGTILDGISADGVILFDSQEAFLLKASWVVLDDDGSIGVRTVEENDIVAFKPITIIDQTADGIWASGLSDGDQVITLGQDFVAVGEKVRVSEEDDTMKTAELAQ
jgi:multidrug efflux system membrane fusion protein